MTGDITANRIANAIRMKDKNKTKNFLIVEGITDQVFFNKFIEKSYCDIEIAFGNLNVIAVVQNLATGGFSGAIGIIDSDFRVINGEIFGEGPIFLSDFHDLEIMFISSDTFSDVLNAYNVEQKLASQWKSYIDFRMHLFEIVKSIGHLKLINNRNNYKIKFKPDVPDGKYIDYSKFVDIKSLAYLGDKELIDTVLKYENQQAKINVDRKTLLEDIKNLDKNIDKYHLCNGHDFMQLIALALRKNISNLNSNAIGHKQIEREFALAYDSRFFKTTNLYSKIKGWEQNTGKIILNC
ncbi:hypothetical protein [Flavobacterium sp.]|uniref:hypothetical protein n=1 Tax=Flavobacterium sp. TaxID=239 RepID=UPI004033B95F